MLRMILLSVCMVCLGQAGQEAVTKDGIRYFVWKAEAAKVRVIWKDENGKQLRELPEVKHYLETKGEKPLMLMNGGIFEPGGVPSGVMIQNGQPLLPVNRRDGKGNFFLKPNGVFLIGDKGPVSHGDREVPTSWGENFLRRPIRTIAPERREGPPSLQLRLEVTTPPQRSGHHGRRLGCLCDLRSERTKISKPP